jgi:diguanylate cyclase (GGDEF)-like protein
LLIQELGEPYLKFLDRVSAAGGDLQAAQRASMGFDHYRVTARLLAQWGLPRTLSDAVDWHPGPEEPSSSAEPMPVLAQVLHLAELLTQLLVDERTEVLGQLLATGQTCHELSQGQLERLVNVLSERVEHLAEVLCLQLPENVDYPDLLIRAQKQLAEVASDAAELLLRRQFETPAGSVGINLLAECQALSAAAAELTQRSADAAPPQPASLSSSESPLPEAVGPPAGMGVRSPLAIATATCPAPARRTSPLDIDPGLLGQLSATVTACRQSRCALSLLIAELDNAEELTLRYGIERLASLRRFLEVLCRRLDHRYAICLPQGEAGFVVILPRCDRRLAVELGSQLVERIRQLGLGRSQSGRPAVSVSVGVATVALPPKNFPAQELLVAADRCLYSARASGGGVVKSIENF